MEFQIRSTARRRAKCPAVYLFSAFGQRENFSAPFVFLPLRRFFCRAKERHFYRKSRKPQYAFFNFIGVIAKRKPNKKWVHAGEHHHPRGFAFEPLDPAKNRRAFIIFAHIERKTRQPYAVE